MDQQLKERIKVNIESSIRNFFVNRDVRTTHVLDYIFPKERRIRSLVGGLETSLGTTLWEPIARTIAESNGFTVIPDRLEMPDKLPKEVSEVVDKWRRERENRSNSVTLQEYVYELRTVISGLNLSNLKFINVTSGEGVDLWLKKDGVEYLFDIKTNQINQSSGLKLNSTLMNWYAYRLCKEPQAQLKAHIAFPFNPYETSWWSKNGSRAYPLNQGIDALIENNFWSFLSGETGTWEEIRSLFIELGNEGFGSQFSEIFNP
ncbi:hypothetical protein AJ85_16850 [Alkalihalobacillus alcalophilus ATCC 27647 = CGMCC 1.3604]|uniref:type II site-specific deoxyribonuclease n=1 Tax=Alkalihalobacillus alcalophilus ATCC 27647 = CGMCC 1.3604 TaxID=1218173 RepID=A0A094WG84_ALKAL|nr:TdeIII family type II restriction endonuclease [Alkalihalobacillus alcalophilus]KGA96739.1 hypothetical protein BALCAV_0214355 [Alkalihalobacillus alcalophilus ATCC 27647 = CGMCC 1.3604]MED1563808.1 TdeIII family type II restriction endonuclease [Alkalihalobacillus alcalophilus]THG92112.1 hypothetical protein AJ85_16850 [Alkalihalobacillus alcalophilus ATCC 27647 = CGMCC 1.3604]